MNIEKNKEDELFLEFLNNNPGAMQLFNMVQEMNNNPNAGFPTKSPRKSIGLVSGRTSLMPTKSPAKTQKLLPIGKSPQRSTSSTAVTAKSPLRSTSTTSILSKSPGRQSIAIGKSPKKSTSVTNLKPITPSRKTWGKVDNVPEMNRGDFNENYALNYSTPTKNEAGEETKAKLKALGVTPLVMPLKMEDENRSPKTQSKTSRTTSESNRPLIETNSNINPKSPGSKKSQLSKSVKEKKGGMKKKKLSKENKEPKESKEKIMESRDSKELKDIKDSKELRETKDSKELRETKDTKDGKDIPKELKETKDLRDTNNALTVTKDKKKKSTRGKPDVSEDDGPPPPNFIPLPPAVEPEREKSEPVVVSDPINIFSRLVNIYNGMDLSPKSSHHKTVKYAFSGIQMIDWFMENRLCRSRQVAVQLGTELYRLGLFEGVSRGTEFKDSKTLYTLTTKGRAIRSGQVLQYFSMAFDPKDGVEIKDRVIQIKKQKMCFVGEELVTWFIENNVVASREMAIKIGKEFVDSGLIEHVSQEYHFRDDRFYYALTREGTIQRIQANTASTIKLEDMDNRLKSSEDQGIKEESKPIPPPASLSKTNIPSKPEEPEKPSPPDEMMFAESEDVETVPPLKTNVAALRSQLAGGIVLNSFLPGAAPQPALPKAKSVTNVPSGPLERVHKIKGPANRRLPQKYTSMRSETSGVPDLPDDFTAPISNSAKSSSSSLDEFPDRSQADDAKSERVSVAQSKPEPAVTKSSEPPPKPSNPAPIKTTEPPKPTVSIPPPLKAPEQPKPTEPNDEVISIPEHIIKLLTDENSLKNFRQYLVKNCKFHEIDYTDFLSEVYRLSKEKNVRNRTVLKREIYKNYISETSPTFLHLPVTLNNNIQASMDGRSTSFTVFAESSGWVSDRLADIISEYIQTTKVVEEPVVIPEKVKLFKPNEEDCFMYNLDFCFAVSSFKVNYLTKNSSERTEEIMNIVNKFLNEEKPKISISNTDNFFNVLNNIKSGSFKIDVFDKLISDVAEVLNATAKNPNENETGIKNPVTPGRSNQSRQLVAPMSTKKPVSSSMVTPSVIPSKPEPAKETPVETKPVLNPDTAVSTAKSWRTRVKATEKTDPVEKIVKNQKPEEVINSPIFIRVTEKDPKTDFVVGRIWKSHQYKFNSEETKLICYLNSNEVSEFCIELSKLTSIHDIVESDQLSEPENSKYVWSILPLKILYACSSSEERTNWLSFIRSKIPSNSPHPITDVVPTPVVSQVSQPIPPQPVTEPTKTSSIDSSVVQKPSVPVEVPVATKPSKTPKETPSKNPITPSTSRNSVTPSVKPLETPSKISNNEGEGPAYRTLRRTSQASEPAAGSSSFSIILRRFNKRGGVRVAVPDTLEKLLQIASEKLKITAVRIREVDTEAELSELNLLKPDMLVWVMTEEEELEFL